MNWRWRIDKAKNELKINIFEEFAIMRYKLRNNVLIKNEKSGLLVTRKGPVTTIENVMYPVFIDREEELQFEKIANMCMDREVNRDIILSKA